MYHSAEGKGRIWQRLDIKKPLPEAAAFSVALAGKMSFIHPTPFARHQHYAVRVFLSMNPTRAE